MIPKQYFPGRMLKWDVSVPLNKIVEFLDRARSIGRAQQEDAIVYAAGHVGDGNIHFSIFPQGEDGAKLEALCATLYAEIDALIWELGGSIVAEHGVGSVFVERVRDQKSAIEYAMLKKIKHAFDPHGIMNPGKLLAD